MGASSPALVPAMLFMVLLGAIPRRYWYVQLPAVPARRPWVTLSDGTSLCTQAGPAVIPVHDSDIIAEFLDRRRARCSP